MNADQHSGAREDAIANRISQADVDIIRGAHVADSGDAGHESDSCVGAGVQRLFGDRFLQVIQRALFVVVAVHSCQMRVSVDKAWQERRVSEINHFGAGRYRRAHPDGRNLPIRYHDEPGLHKSIALAIEHPRRFQHVGLARRFLRLAECRRGHQKS